MKVLIYGVGATGARVARQLLSNVNLDGLCLIDEDEASVLQAAESLGGPAEVIDIQAMRSEVRLEKFFDAVEGCDVAILTAADDHVAFAEAALRSGVHVVSLSDDVDVVEELSLLDGLAFEMNKSLVMGAAFSPGLSCVLAKHGAQKFDNVDEIHVARFGTGGPLCARQHHRALRNDALNRVGDAWVSVRGGSGRELFWFPDPVGGLDCYQAALVEPLLLHEAFPKVEKITARLAANRRDRSTKWLPILRKPHPEGLAGAIRVELRGTSNGVRETMVYGVLDRPAVAAGTVAAIAAIWAYNDSFERFGAGSLASLVQDTSRFLASLSFCGVRAAVFEGLSSQA